MKDTWAIFFSLTEHSAVNACAVIDGATVKIHKNDKEMDVTNLVANGQEQAIAAARFWGNLFLNKLSWGYNRHLEIAHPIKAVHILHSGQEEVKDIEPPTVYSASIEMQIVDSCGNVVADSTELGTIEVERSEAASYYRRACLSRDHFDRFRNFYLAVENIADRIRLKGGFSKQELKKTFNPQSYEQSLLQLALDECFGQDVQPLIETMKKICTLDDRQPVVQQVANILYDGYRCQLGHAKAIEDKKIPFNPKNEEEVKTVIPLMEFVAKSILAYEETSLSK